MGPRKRTILAKEKKSGIRCVLKELLVMNQSDIQSEEQFPIILRQELVALHSLESPFLTKLHSVFLEGDRLYCRSNYYENGDVASWVSAASRWFGEEGAPFGAAAAAAAA
eukprot:CAMPEP_0194738894 /NCGR_PEP_ID=MMETSP0296-20130528/86586_1 /TAXON_ID=39354 /ORGANISM="Heterosigma akashiwo, Strain CCMP2393" /LENGTH=109 /DNA_ID=CAMNT_0039649445 /DNA_START=48 /DNA_END=374 /DNA_ORIENTATION=+